MWRFLLVPVAIVTAIILIGMSVAGGHGMFKDEWLQFGASVGVGIIDVAEIAFLLAMIAMAFDAKWGRAALCGVLWLSLSGATVFTSQAWLKSEIAKVWRPTDNATKAEDTAQKHLEKVNENLLSTDWKTVRAAKRELPNAQAGVKQAQTDAPEKPVELPIKGNEWIATFVLLFISHAAWFVAFGHGSRTASQDMARWARRQPAGQDRSGQAKNLSGQVRTGGFC